MTYYICIWYGTTGERQWGGTDIYIIAIARHTCTHTQHTHIAIATPIYRIPRKFRGRKVSRFSRFFGAPRNFFHENISVAIEKWALIAITMGIRESFFVKICVMH